MKNKYEIPPPLPCSSKNHDLLEANQKLLNSKLLYDDEDHVFLSEPCYLETIKYRVVDHII